MDKVGGEAEEKSHDEEDIILATSHFVERGKTVIDQEVGDGDLAIEDYGEGTSLDVIAEGGDKAGGDRGA